MAGLGCNINFLTKDEIIYELSIRKISVSSESRLDELRRKLRSTLKLTHGGTLNVSGEEADGDAGEELKIHGANKDEKLRVRRARPADVPRVLRFVRENARVAWPSFVNAQQNFHLVLGDYVARALAQGHSMLAEQLEPKRGWTHIRGLAISTTVCPWDAMMLEQWARCVKCKRSRQLVHFTAHCLRAPGLHDKYRVHNILQVILMVPPDNPRATEIIHMLAKNTIKRGREVGLPLLRFDVVNDPVARALDDMNLVKEWELSYNLLPDDLKERDEALRRESDSKALKDETKNVKEVNQEGKQQNKGHFIAVYTVSNQTDK